MKDPGKAVRSDHISAARASTVHGTVRLGGSGSVTMRNVAPSAASPIATCRRQPAASVRNIRAGRWEIVSARASVFSAAPVCRLCCKEDIPCMRGPPINAFSAANQRHFCRNQRHFCRQPTRAEPQPVAGRIRCEPAGPVGVAKGGSKTLPSRRREQPRGRLHSVVRRRAGRGVVG